MHNPVNIKQNHQGNAIIETTLRGTALLRSNLGNKGTAFSAEERRELGLEGLLPPAVETLEQQVERLYAVYLRQPDGLAKYQYLRAVQDESEVAFFALLRKHISEMMPIVYTPTVGLAVQEFSHLFQQPRGLTFTADNGARAAEIVKNAPGQNVRVIVATDASAILGIGDQGHGGMGISIGKLALYTAGGGIDPYQVLPVDLDVGTDRETLLEDPLYLGVPSKRLTGKKYLELVDQFVDAITTEFPKAIIQWEDFAKDVAFEVLDRYQDRVPSFNDDIQGTGAVVLAGLLAACKKSGTRLRDQRVVIAGAGAGGVGVAKAILEGMIYEGLSRDEARRQLFVLDGRGLVLAENNPDNYKSPVAQLTEDCADWQIKGKIPSLAEVIEFARPTALLGLSGVQGLFTRELIEKIAAHCETPIIFPLSNPTANCEAKPQDIITWTDGKAIIATGSPFEPVTYQERTYPIGQGNNAFIFPGLGFAATHGECRTISERMVIASAYALAEYTIETHGDEGLIFPPISELATVCKKVAQRCLKQALEDGITRRSGLDENNLEAFVDQHYWQAEYLPVVAV
ncbi:MAG: NAD-dependent malic enzyme [Thiotrichales bacterium]